MPIFEYICAKCGTEFSELVRSSDEKPRCPVCASEKVEKKVSTFASVGNGSSGFSASPNACTRFS